MKNLIIVLGITTCIAGYAAPAAADDLCDDVCRWARRQVEPDREAKRRNDRLQREWDADRQQANADRE